MPIVAPQDSGYSLKEVLSLTLNAALSFAI